MINYCDAAQADPEKEPENYWANTSGNAMVRRFIDKANQQTRNEIEQLISGKTIAKEINLDLTYNELDSTINHLWSVLFTTGYLTHRGQTGSRTYRLCIPNREIRELFITKVKEWFQEVAGDDHTKLEQFCLALLPWAPAWAAAL